ncbi:MAG: RNA 2',3'-cyclic phosphodiesterase [Spirochaetes bacterium]|nr:RNA 2',3'-cyclic phosphodiesterase [Spirochaetota bacterium]
MPRLFIALPVNNIINDKTNEIYNYFNKYKELKVVPPENYHITLKFLGECSEKTANKIKDNFNDNLIDIKKIISFTLFGLGVFPDLKNPNVIWAGIKTDETAINKLSQSVENFTSDLGFKKEKNKFVPHLTLARIRKGSKLNEQIRQYLVENKELFFFESKFNKLALYSSTLTKEGPVYTEIQSINFSPEQ